MSSSKITHKRARPALGTILVIRCEVPEEVAEVQVDEAVVRVFELCEELEAKVSKFSEASDVSRLNAAVVGRDIPVSREFCVLLELALELSKNSGGAFQPLLEATPLNSENYISFYIDGSHCFARRLKDVKIDLTGLAKGFIVDRLVESLVRDLPQASGVINAGGDLRFFGEGPREVDVATGGSGKLLRKLLLNRESFATSSFVECRQNPGSSTVYLSSPRAGLDESFSVSVAADRCVISDALTKVGWFAEPSIARACAEKYGAEILIFDSAGELVAP